MVAPDRQTFTTTLEAVLDVLEAEAEGRVRRWTIFSISRDRALAYQKEEFVIPEMVQRATEEYRVDMDLLSGWLEECCELDPARYIEAHRPFVPDRS